jgi:hypothetical protein
MPVLSRCVFRLVTKAQPEPAIVLDGDQQLFCAWLQALPDVLRQVDVNVVVLQADERFRVLRFARQT